MHGNEFVISTGIEHGACAELHHKFTAPHTFTYYYIVPKMTSHVHFTENKVFAPSIMYEFGKITEQRALARNSQNAYDIREDKPQLGSAEHSEVSSITK